MTDAITSPRPAASNAASTSWPLISLAFLSVGVAVFSYRYLIGLGIAPPKVIAANSFKDPWLVIHVAGAATALLLGPAQFFPSLRNGHRQLHRATGRLYVLACTAGSLSGLVLAFGATTGLISTMGFGTLAVAWLGATFLAWRRAVQRRIPEHQAWMIRSFALTFAAVTLRLYLPIAALLPFPFVDSYRAISFLAWVPNLLVAELYLRGRRHVRIRFAGYANAS
jgi:uncharacterized membrane protein